MLVLELLGTLALRNETRPVPVSAQQKRSLGLLAILGVAGKQGFPRDRIESYLWPESSGPLARHSLDQTAYAVRQALGSNFLISTSRELRLNPDLIEVDAWKFEEEIRAGQWAAAVDRYKGTLLDGFHFTESREFESWINGERARLREEYQKAVELLANAAVAEGDHSRSAMWWRRLANSDPLSVSATRGLMLALAASGDRAGAVKQARLYQQLLQQNEIDPDSEIDSLAVALSRASTTDAVPRAVENAPQNSPIVYGSATTKDNALIDSSLPALLSDKKSHRRERAMLSALIPIVGIITAAGMWGWMRPSASSPVTRYRLAFDSTQEISSGDPWSGRIALSPDGLRVAYIGGPLLQLMIRPTNQLRATVVPGTDGALTPFFKPDGSQVGFLEEQKILIASINGGPLVTVTDTLIGVAGASWGPDGFIYADGSGRTSLLRVEARQGAKPSWFTVLDSASGEYDHTWPEILPNGKGVLFTVSFNGRNGVKGKTSYAIAVAEIPSGKHRILVNDAVYSRYSASGHLLYVTTNKTLMVARFDQKSMKLTGEPAVVAQGMRLGGLGAADLAVSTTGTLLYTTGAGEGNHELVWVTRAGKTQSVDASWQGGFLYFPALSPDGKWVAVSRSATTEPVNIWIKRLDQGQSTKLTLERKNNVGPAWTPDGRSVTFSSESENGTTDLWTKRADGLTPPVLQLHEKRNSFVPRWSPNGKWLVFQTDPSQAGSGDILGIRPGIDSAPVPLVVSKFTEVAPAISADGRWMAYASNETGTFEIYVVPFPNTGAAKWAISNGGGTEPLWSHNGSELFYRDSAQSLVAVAVQSRPSFSIGHSTVLFSAAAFDAYNFSPMYAVAADDRRFMMSRPAQTSAPDKVIVVENWFEELNASSRKAKR